MPLIASMTELTAGNLSADDFIVAYDASAGTDKKVPADEILEGLLSTFGKTLIDDADAATFLTTIGVSTFGQSMLDDANAAAILATLGLDADLATLALPANTTIDTYAATWGDDADAATLRATLGVVPVWTYDSQISLSGAGPIVLTTSIPSGAVEVEVLIDIMSTDGADDIHIDMGDAGGYETSGYKNLVGLISATNSAEAGTASGFRFFHVSGGGAGSNYSGMIRLIRDGTDNNLWWAEGVGSNETTNVHTMVGWKTMSEALTSIRIGDSGNNFDEGEARVRYRGAT
jgi:hypothetical protein